MISPVSDLPGGVTLAMLGVDGGDYGDTWPLSDCPWCLAARFASQPDCYEPWRGDSEHELPHACPCRCTACYEYHADCQQADGETLCPACYADYAAAAPTTQHTTTAAPWPGLCTDIPSPRLGLIPIGEVK